MTTPDFMLRVGKPAGRKLTWDLPVPHVGASAHYLYDISGNKHLGLREGSRLFLFRGSSVPTAGLFALATCEVRDDQTIAAEKEHDAFVRVRFEAVLEEPITIDTLAAEGREAESAMRKFRNDGNLQMRRLSDVESTALISVFANAMTGHQA